MPQFLSSILPLLKIICVIGAALLIGNWYLTEVKKAKQQGAPWYRPYLSIPGLIIIIAILFPLIYLAIKRFIA
ncbi:MAG: hypothetical protein QNI92_11835 [Desulfobacterales bacterium]|nr:hypothetical protein [Desulfobacterales bacterium]